MRITGYTLHEVVVPVHQIMHNSACFEPLVWDQEPIFICEVYSDEGITGLAETYRSCAESTLRGGLEMLAQWELEKVCWQEHGATDRSHHEELVFNKPHLYARLHERTANSMMPVYLQTALFDLLGKKWGLPMYQLLGGAYREWIPVSYWMPQQTPEESVRNCKRGVEMGYVNVKCKCTISDDNVERAQAVCDALGPEFKMTFDPNFRFYRYGEAVDMIKKMVAVGNIACIEDPFLPAHLEGYRMLREQGLCPIARHVALDYGPDFIRVIKEEAADYMNLSLLPTDTKKAGDICWAAGIPTWHGGGADLGIIDTMALHVSAATKSMTLPGDIHGRALRSHNLITNPLKPTKGYVQVPPGAGLGIELDRDALDRHTKRKIEHRF